MIVRPQIFAIYNKQHFRHLERIVWAFSGFHVPAVGTRVPIKNRARSNNSSIRAIQVFIFFVWMVWILNS